VGFSVNPTQTLHVHQTSPCRRAGAETIFCRKRERKRGFMGRRSGPLAIAEGIPSMLTNLFFCYLFFLILGIYVVQKIRREYRTTAAIEHFMAFSFSKPNDRFTHRATDRKWWCAYLEILLEYSPHLLAPTLEIYHDQIMAAAGNVVITRYRP
jgi:hypothetical protein